ncbi:hypothetical protein ACFZBU_40445 [Embleya sp. NPDC008237]|uniref:hypothetical protein n=1 Tax=Embleya sp. NPDC008237 TaxID=3363978 RepID=UPI0036EE92F8
MSSPRTPEDFGAAFTALLNAAGVSVDGVRRLLGERRGLVSRSTLYDWRKGEHLPEDTAPLLAVVDLCLDLAAGHDLTAGSMSVPGDDGQWLTLLAEAKQSRDSRTAQARGSWSVSTRYTGAGRPVDRWDPVVLGVHKAIGGGPLPPYVRRAHDEVLHAVLDPDIADNRLVVLRGGSSIGKSRTAYQALAARLPRRPLIHPRTATALAAQLREGVAAGTVLWLDELRHYADDPTGEQALFDLAELVSDRAYIVAVTTVWPDYWAAYLADPHGGPGTPDPFRAARALLTPLPDLTGRHARDVDARCGGVLDVPDHFTDDDLARARRRDDPILREAAGAAERAGSAGRLAQYLAAIPDLIAHYQGPGADPYGHALITAAMDAARVGRGRVYPSALLQEAALGYLAPRHRTVDAAEWRDAAWSYATRTLKGAIQALEPVAPENGTGVVGYRLADYLDQHGLRCRASVIPPAPFWHAVAAHADPGDLPDLASAAYLRGLYRHAARLHKRAAVSGRRGAASLVGLLRRLHPTDDRPAAWAARHVRLHDGWELHNLLRELRESGPDEAIGVLLAREPARHAQVDSGGVETLLRDLCELGAADQVATLAGRAARFSPVHKPHDAASLVETMGKVGAVEQLRTLADRIAIETHLDFPAVMRPLLARLDDAGAVDQAARLADRIAGTYPLDDAGLVESWLRIFREAGLSRQARVLVGRDPAGRVSLDRDPIRTAEAAGLLLELHRIGAAEQVAALAARAAAEAPLDTPNWVADLIRALDRVGSAEHASALALRAAGETPLEETGKIARLLWWLEPPARTIVLDRSPQVSLRSSVCALVDLVRQLRRMGATGHLAKLLERDPAARVPLDSADDVLDLLAEFLEVDALDQVERLAVRAATQVSPDYPLPVGRLLRWLWELGAVEESSALAAHLAAHTPLDRPGNPEDTLEALRSVGADRHICTLLARITAFAEQVPVTDPRVLASLLDVLREAEATDHIRLLAARAAAGAPLGDLFGIGRLLVELHNAGADDQAALLAARIVADPSLDAGNVDERLTLLLGRLRSARTYAQAEALIERLPAMRQFPLFAEQSDNRTRFRFGREPNGHPAEPWGWDDLD